MWKARAFHWFNLISNHVHKFCCKLANVANYAFFGVIFCLKNCGSIIFWPISRLSNCALCLKFNCYSPACIACLRNFHILQSARVAVLPLEWTGNAAHHRHVKGTTKETLQQQMGVSNFANNSHSAFTGFLNQSLLYHNILHHQVWRQWNSATGARQCMFIERPKPYGPPYTGPPPTEEIQDDDSVSGSCGETWWYGRQCFTYQAPWPWMDIIYQEFQWKKFIWDGGSGRVTEVGFGKCKKCLQFIR